MLMLMRKHTRNHWLVPLRIRPGRVIIHVKHQWPSPLIYEEEEEDVIWQGQTRQTVYIRQRWKYLFSEHDRDLVRDKRAWVHGGFMGILCDYPYSDAYKIYMTAADCNELEKSQVLHPSLQAVKSWMYDGHMVWLARQRDWCDRVVAVVGDLTNIWTDNSSSVSTLPLPNRADGQSCRVKKFSQFCKVLNLGSREIAWASGMNFPIPPLFWWSNNATSLAICKLYLKFNSWKKSRNQKKRPSLSDCSVKFGKGETKSISRFPPRFLFQCFQRHTKYFLVLLNQSFEILLYCCKCHLIFELMMMVMAQQWYLRWMCVE